jgi:hypothetical protein
VPAKNEAATIADTVEALLSIDGVTQVLVIDDGSTDDTAALAREAGASVLRFPHNQGQAQAIMAGARAIPHADIFLIVDGDVGSSAVLAEALLTPVLDDEADMTIANLPPAATGGFGTVKRTAQWGVRKATGVELKAPISGQRAMRADLLRSMQPSGHFGFSVSISIDAIRRGARTIDVDVPLTHRHTGKTLGGFVHRGKQGFFLLRALWPRLTSSRFRIGLACGVLGLLTLVLAISGAQHAKVEGVVQPSARQVVIFGMPGLTWEEIEAEAPNLRELTEEGAVGDLMVRTGSSGASTHEAYTALGAANPVRARLPVARALPADTEFESDTAAEALARRTGVVPAGDIVVLGAPEVQLDNESRHLSTDAGALGDALRDAGKRTAVVGNADVDVVDDDGTRGVRRPAAAAVMTAGGSVDTGEVSPALLTLDPEFADGRRTDPGAFLAAFDRAREDADVIVLDPGDLDRADEQQGTSLPDAASALRARTLAATDSILGEVRKRIDDDTLLIVTGLRPPRGGSWTLSPVVVSGPGVPHGYANSPGTHREGVATLFDLAPTVLHALDVEVPSEFPGDPLRYQDTVPDIDRLDVLDRDATFRSDVHDGVQTTFIAVQAIVYLLIAAAALFGRVDRWHGLLRLPALGVLAFPPATFLYRAIPDVAALGPPGLVLVVVLDVLLVALAVRMGKHHLAAPVFLIGLLLAILVYDVATGNHLHLSSLLGLSLNSAGRYYGFGNSSLALLAAGSIMLTAIVIELSVRKREMAVICSAFLVFVLIVDGAPMLGNDIGGIMTLAPVFTVYIAMLLRLRITWRTVIVGLVLAVGALAIVAGADMLRSSDSQTHFGKLVESVQEDGWQPLSDTIQRKLGVLVRLLENSVWVPMIPTGLAFLGFALFWHRRRKALFEPSSTLPLGIIATLAAGLLGSIVNDSGPIVMALVLTVLCPIVGLMVLQAERKDEPYLLEPTGPPADVRSKVSVAAGT